MKRLITRLRPACTADSDDIYNVHRYAVRYTCLESYDREILDAWLALLSPAHYPAAIRSSSKAVWVIELHERIHGFFQLDLAQAQLDALYVLPFVHRRGLGTACCSAPKHLPPKPDWACSACMLPIIPFLFTCSTATARSAMPPCRSTATSAPAAS